MFQFVDSQVRKVVSVDLQSGDDEGMLNKEVRRGHSIRCVLVIPAHNEEEGVRDCLDAVAAAILPQWAEWEEWILLDGGSTDMTVEHWNAWSSLHCEFPMRVLRSPERIGKAAELEQVRQILEKRADRGLVMVVCDADSRVDPLAFHHLLSMRR